MAADKFPLILPGDPLSKVPAAGMNSLFDMAREWEGNKKAPASTQTRDDPPTWWGPKVRVKNGTAAAIPAGAILGISGVVFPPEHGAAQFRLRPVLSGTYPSDPETFVIARDPTAEGKLTTAYAAGLAICKVSFSKNYHKFARAITGDTAKLESCDVGPARIWYSENAGAPGVQWAAVLLGGPPPDLYRDVVLKENMGATSSFQAKFDWIEGLPYAGGDIMGHDPRNRFENAVTGQEMAVMWVNGRWQFVDGPCEALTIEE